MASNVNTHLHPLKQRGSEIWTQSGVKVQIAAVGRASLPMLQEIAESGVMERLIDCGKASLKVMQLLQKNNLASQRVLDEIVRQKAPSGKEGDAVISSQ